ncbi:MAG: FAD:protein FMN transferase [Alphaproteobacteria bacterium]|nr:FAD:protein FMN transferase [Alphaproteobacteria bacterium]
MNNMRIFKYFSIIILLFILVIWLSGVFSSYQEFSGSIYNTYYSIKIRSKKSNANLSQQIKQTLDDINSKMSVFIKDSELNKINQSKAYTNIRLSADLSDVLKSAAKINLESDGYFDPSISPLIDVWGFGRNKNTTTPKDSKIKEILTYSKFNKLMFSDDYLTISKKDDRTELNLSAIAKGYAVDKISQLLEKSGYQDYIIDIGGEVKASGYRDNNKNPWNIGVSAPLKNKNSSAFVLTLTNTAVATSGDYRNFITAENGETFSHTISPKTGYPVIDKLASVTVLHQSCMMADAYATAIMAMGYEKGMQFANKYKIPIIVFIHQQDNRFDIKLSDTAQTLMGE